MSLHDLLIEKKALLHVSCAGAGGALIKSIWSTPGCSQYLVGSYMLNGRHATHDFLGFVPENGYVSRKTAFDLAMESYIRAAEMKVAEGSQGDPIAVGVEAAVSSTRTPKGGYRAHMAVICANGAYDTMWEWVSAVTGAEAREFQDHRINELARDLLIEAFYSKASTAQADAFALSRFYDHPVFHTDGTRSASSVYGLYMPATLNPLHDGHRMMCRAAEASPGEAWKGANGRARYLVSSSSAHKGDMSLQQMLTIAGTVRAERWRAEHEPRSVEFTRDEPLFIDKVRKRPGSTFVIGADAMQRMLDPKWGHDVAIMLDEMRQLGAKFLVMGRLVDGIWKECRDIPVSWPNQLLFQPLHGRKDISSSELRGEV